jgi:hypothetical protein
LKLPLSQAKPNFSKLVVEGCSLPNQKV